MIYDGYRREWWRYRAVSWPGMGEGRDLGLYTGGSVELSALSDMRVQGTLDYAGEVPRRGELVRIYYGFADESGAELESPVGTFFVSPGDPSLGGAVVTGTAELESMLKPALAGGYGRPYVVAAGSDPVAEAGAIFSRLGLATNGATSSRRLASDVVYDPDDKWITIANDLLSRAGYAGAYPDPWGSIVMEPYRDPSERPVAWTFRDGDGSIMLPAVIYTALVFQLKDPMLYYPLSILAGIVGGAVPSILWQFTPNTVEDADIPAANAFMAFTQNIGMTIGALIIGNAIVMWGWSMGSLIGMVPLYIICLIIYFAFGVQKKLKLQ